MQEFRASVAGWWLWVRIIVIALITVRLVVDGASLALINCAVVLGASLLGWCRTRLVVRPDAVVVSWWPVTVWPAKRLPIASIAAVERIDDLSFRWFGAGRGTWTAVARAGPGVDIHTTEGRVVRVTVDEPDAAVAAIEQARVGPPGS